MIDLLAKMERQVMWHLPGRDARYVGSFLFDPQKQISLSTNIAWDHDDYMLFRGRSSVDVILLADSTGALWTLVDCVISSLGTSSVVFFVGLALRGAHFSSKDSIVLRRKMIRFPYMDTWLGRNPLHMLTMDANQESWKYERPADIEFEMAKIGVRLIFGGDRSSGSDSDPPSLSINYNTSVVIESLKGELQSLAWFQEKGFHIHNLLSLLLGQPLWRIHEAATIAQDDCLDLVFRQTTTSRAGHLHSDHVLVHFHDIKEEFQTIVENWLMASVTLQPVMDLLAGYVSDPGGFLQSKLLMLTTAFEVFHRRARGGTYMSAGDYTPLCQRMVEHLPNELNADHKQALKNRLTHGNEYSLRKRFAEVFVELPEPLLDFFPRREQFVGQIVDWRNQLTHYVDPAKEHDLQNIDELYLSCRRIEVLLVILLLNHAGIRYDLLATGLARCPRYRNLVADREHKPSESDAANSEGGVQIKGVFWDHPELKSETALRNRLISGSDADRSWILARMLEYGRVEDTMRLFDLDEIKRRLHFLPLRDGSREMIFRKWQRMFEIYGTARK